MGTRSGKGMRTRFDFQFSSGAHSVAAGEFFRSFLMRHSVFGADVARRAVPYLNRFSDEGHTAIARSGLDAS